MGSNTFRSFLTSQSNILYAGALVSSFVVSPITQRKCAKVHLRHHSQKQQHTNSYTPNFLPAHVQKIVLSLYSIKLYFQLEERSVQNEEKKSDHISSVKNSHFLAFMVVSEPSWKAALETYTYLESHRIRLL